MIETRGLSRSFGSKPAVRNLDLSVRRAEIYGFLGPNGAGKTTTIRMLCGLLRPDSGSIEIGGVDLQRDPRAVRSQLALVPDTPPLYEYLTGVEYIGFVTSLYGVPAKDRDERCARYLEVLDLAERGDDLCKGFSHGMRKKLHIAAVLTVAPPLLVLDEPTSGLDPKSARILKDLLKGARDAGTTVFLSTHVLSVAEEICDRIGILSRGELLAEGTMDELRSSGAQGSLEDIFLQLTEEADAGA